MAVSAPPLEVSGDITKILSRWESGDRQAVDELFPKVYRELHRLADHAIRKEGRDHTLQTTGLVHEAYLHFSRRAPLVWKDRIHFYAVAARLMRHILLDYARSQHRGRRGTRPVRVPLENIEPAANQPVDLLQLNRALNALASIDQRKAAIVELRFFGGLSVEDTAQYLNISIPTVIRDTRMARAWLYKDLLGEADDEPTRLDKD